MKKFIYKTAYMTLMKCTEEFIEKGITPMITIGNLRKSDKYKEVDKFLLEQGYKKNFVDQIYNDGLAIPRHYEYIKK